MIIGFIYFIGVGIAIITKQINIGDFVSMASLFIISAGILGICSFFFFKAIFHIKNIPKVVKEI